MAFKKLNNMETITTGGTTTIGGIDPNVLKRQPLTMDEASKSIHEVLAQFSEKDQNQLLKSIRERLTNDRDERIKQLQEQIDQLKDSMDQL